MDGPPDPEPWAAAAAADPTPRGPVDNAFMEGLLAEHDQRAAREAEMREAMERRHEEDAARAAEDEVAKRARTRAENNAVDRAVQDGDGWIPAGAEGEARRHADAAALARRREEVRAAEAAIQEAADRWAAEDAERREADRRAAENADDGRGAFGGGRGGGRGGGPRRRGGRGGRGGGGRVMRYYRIAPDEPRPSKKIVPFPSSPKPRASMGTLVVRAFPPERVKVSGRDGAKRFVSVKPRDSDWKIPENHLVFVWVAKNKKKLNMRSAPLSAKRRRINVVADAFANWFNRSGTLEHLADTDKIPRDYEIRLVGVSYEGVTSALSAKSNPDANGRIAVTPNGIVCFYASTDLLERQNAQVGDVLMWHPVSSRTSWKEHGPDFETCLVGVFKMSDYELRADGPPGGHVDRQHEAADMQVDPRTTGAPMVVGVNAGGGVAGTDSYNVRVPMEGGYNPARMVMAPGPMSDAQKAYLAFTGTEKANPSFRGYMDLMARNGLDPFTIGGQKLTPEEQGRIGKAWVMDKQMQMHFGGSRPIHIGSGGAGDFTAVPDDMRTEAIVEIMRNGANRHSIQYVYPGDFDKSVDFMHQNNAVLFEHMRAAGVIYPNHNHSPNQPTWALDLTALRNMDARSATEAEQLLGQAYGDGAGKYVLWSLIHANELAHKYGYQPAYGASSTIHTWDLVYFLAKQLDEARQTGSAHQNAVSDIHTMMVAAAQTGTLGADSRTAIAGLIQQIDGGAEFHKAVATLLRKPVVGIALGPDDHPTAAQVQEGAEKLEAFESEIDKLCRGVGIRTPRNASTNFDKTVELLLARYNSMLGELELARHHTDGVPATMLWTESSVDLLMRSQRGDSLSRTENERVRGIYQAATAQGVDVTQIEYGISILSRVMHDPSVRGAMGVRRALTTEMTKSATEMNNDFTTALTAYGNAHNDEYLGRDIAHALVTSKMLGATAPRVLARILKFFGNEWASTGLLTETVVLKTMNITRDAAVAVATEHEAPFSDAAESSVYNEFRWVNQAPAVAGSCVSAPHVDMHPTTWCKQHSNETGDRQLVTLLTNSDVYGTLLGKTLSSGNPEAASILGQSFLTSIPLDNNKLTLLVRVMRTPDADADATTASDLLDKYIDDNNLTWIAKKATIVDATVHNGNYYAEFRPSRTVGFAEVADLYKNTHDKTFADTGVRLCGVGYVKTFKKLNATIEAHVAAVSTAFADDAKGYLEDDAATTDLATFASTVHGAAAVSADAFYTQFAEFLPPVQAAVTNVSTAACYCIDHPYALAFTCATPASRITTDGTRHAAELMACPPLGENMRSRNASVAATGGKALHTIRPGLSSAPLCVYLAHGGDVRALNEAAASIAGITVHAHFTSPHETAALLDTAARVLPKSEYKKHQRRVEMNDTAGTVHLVNALRAHAQLSMCEAKTTRMIKTGVSFLPDEDVAKSDPAIGGISARHVINGPGEYVRVPDDGPLPVPNPRERCFGTLLSYRNNIVRVQLNLAAATPPIHY